MDAHTLIPVASDAIPRSREISPFPPYLDDLLLIARSSMLLKSSFSILILLYKIFYLFIYFSGLNPKK